MTDSYLTDYNNKVAAIIGTLDVTTQAALTEEATTILGDALTDEAYLETLKALTCSYYLSKVEALNPQTLGLDARCVSDLVDEINYKFITT